MAIAYVNAVSANNATLGTTHVLPALNVTTGNTVVVCTSHYTAGISISSVTDTASNISGIGECSAIKGLSIDNDLLFEEKLMEKATELGDYTLKRLKEMQKKEMTK